jgi:hypothetical protein
MNASDFTPKQIQAIRIAVAEVAGKTEVRETVNDYVRDIMCRANNGRDWSIVPNYPADLNAVHEVEKMLIASDEDGDFRCRYHCVVLPDSLGIDTDVWQHRFMWRLISATALQRCIALLMTVTPDKWEAIKANP